MKLVTLTSKKKLIPSKKSATSELKKLLGQKKNFKSQFAAEDVHFYWRFGKILPRLQPSEIKQAACELGLSSSKTHSCQKFYALYHSAKPWKTNLSWLHYLELIQIPDANERSFYEHEAIRYEWTPSLLAKAVHERGFKKRAGLGHALILADAGRRGRAVGSVHNHVQVSSQTLDIRGTS